MAGLGGKVADGLDEVVVANEQIGAELAQLRRVVGKVMPGERQRCLAVSADDFVPRPHTPETYRSRSDRSTYCRIPPWRK